MGADFLFPAIRKRKGNIMPIGWLIGLSIGLMFSGWTLASANKKKQVAANPQELAIALQLKRHYIIGMTMLELGSFTLTGTLIELTVR